jgi:leucyl/phenylalanyl-tRNA--protein transferase
MLDRPIPPLGYEYIFPNPRYAMDEGLLAYGGDLNPNRVLKAYMQGIFPWFNEGDPILWWSPNPRCILYPKEFKVSKSFAKTLRNKSYSVKFDSDFEKIITLCANVKREGQEGSWIVDEMIHTYTILHQKGFAHSVEVYYEDMLAGGLYGVSLGGAFFGESMFSLHINASKIALYELCRFCIEHEFDYIDCQMPTPHLKSLGAVEITRDAFLNLLQVSNTKPTISGNWSDL